MAGSLAERILSIDPRVRSVLITDRAGRFLEFKTRSPRTRVLMSDGDIRALGGVSSALLTDAAELLAKYFGPASCVTTRMEKADVHTIKLGESIAVVTTRPNDLPADVAQKIKALKP
ncbi:MAG: hypothetical protein QXO51_02640 [Halobacteria archaeon]